jgi:tRNA threonylcarbamoyl adenosine modification protein YeaZ
MSCALALHSCSDSLGIALLDQGVISSHALPLGRRLGNLLFEAVEELLPAGRWQELQWLAVATGPGSFTGTRLTVVLARSLAQQLACPLWGWGSFQLIAQRRAAELAALGPHWIGQTLPRRGVVAGHYGLVDGIALELQPPRLQPQGWAANQDCHWEALMDPEADARQLLDLGAAAAATGQPGPWEPVLPIYPTSPLQP